MKELGLDGLLVSLPANITYLTGHVSRDSWLVLAKRNCIYITDSRYGFEAKKFLPRDFTVRLNDASLFTTIAQIAGELSIENLGFEARYLHTLDFQKLEAALSGKTRLISTQGIIEALREIKTEQEIKKIQKATDIAVKALKFIKKHITPGIREVEIAGEIERFIRLAGGERASFDIIVASGPNSSYPHHRTSLKKVAKNEPVLVDMGVELCGYKSDLTRVFFSGKINPLVRKIYDIVVNAQTAAFKRIKPAVMINKVDMAARQYIAKNGYGGFFSHSLGHGIGLEIHESPRVSPRENRLLKPGMVFSLEPAIYLPGEFGIRIEDLIVVTKKGARYLSGTLDK